MYDLKNFDPISPSYEKIETSNRNIGDRTYFNGKMTSSILNTKTSYIPYDDLF